MIDIRNLKFKYPGKSENTIKNIGVKVSKGEIFGFLGPSGAGKTTTQKIITGLLRGYSGSVKIAGTERSKWDNSFYEKIGVVFEFPNLYLKLSGRENLKLFAGYYKKECNDMIEELKQTGIYSAIDKKVEEYSKGMKVRLNFIRALQHNPDILFLDEPISGLDPVNGAIIKNMIKDLSNQGKTIFLTTHNMSVASELCDRVSFIINGNLPLTDSPVNLMRQYGKNEVKIEYTNNNSKEVRIFNLNNIKGNHDFNNIIENSKVLSMKTQDATLEDIFIMVTGRGLH